MIKKERPVAVYSSGLTRARETAKLIAKVCRRRVIVDDRLNEVSFGRWEGAKHHEIHIKFPEASRNWYRALWSSRPPGGESLRSLGRRVSEFMTELKAKFLDHSRPCVLVTHGGTIRMFLIQILNVTPEIFWGLRVDPASVSMIDITAKRKEVVLLNSQIHLNGLKRGGKVE